MSIKTPSSYREIVESFLPVFRDCRVKFDHLKYSDKDVRGVFFLNCQRMLGNNIMMLNMLMALEEGRIPYEQQRDFIGLATGDLPDAIAKLGKYMRITLVTMIQFQIENMLVNVLSRLNLTAPPRGYFRIVKQVLDKISINDKQQKLDTLMVLQYIRNTLHSNGIHNNDDLCIELGGYTFDFKRGKMINCASWVSLPTAIGTSMGVLSEILQAPEIRAIPEPIKDQYIEVE